MRNFKKKVSNDRELKCISEVVWQTLKWTIIFKEAEEVKEESLNSKVFYTTPQSPTHFSCNESPPKHTTKLYSERTCLHTILARMKCLLDLHDKILHELFNPDLPMCGTSISTNMNKILTRFLWLCVSLLQMDLRGLLYIHATIYSNWALGKDILVLTRYIHVFHWTLTFWFLFCFQTLGWFL
jgi:hypothetical protein